MQISNIGNDGQFPMHSFATSSEVSLLLPYDISFIIFFTFFSFSLNFLLKRSEKSLSMCVCVCGGVVYIHLPRNGAKLNDLFELIFCNHNRSFYIQDLDFTQLPVHPPLLPTLPTPQGTSEVLKRSQIFKLPDLCP